MDNAPIGRVESTKCPKSRGRKQRRECEILALRLLAGGHLINPPADTQVCGIVQGLCQMSHEQAVKAPRPSNDISQADASVQ